MRQFETVPQPCDYVNAWYFQTVFGLCSLVSGQIRVCNVLWLCAEKVWLFERFEIIHSLFCIYLWFSISSLYSVPVVWKLSISSFLNLTLYISTLPLLGTVLHIARRELLYLHHFFICGYFLFAQEWSIN